MNRSFIFFFALSSICVGATITPSGINASSTFFTYNASSLVDGSGLTGLLHDNEFSNMWLSDNLFPGVDPFSGTLTVQFAGNVRIAAIRLWNYNYDDLAQNPDLLNRGARDIAVSYVSGGTRTQLGQFTLSRGTGQALSAETFVLSAPVDASEFQFEILTNYGDRDYVGLSEIQFLSDVSGGVTGGGGTPSGGGGGEVPEPGAWVLVSAGLGWILRRGQSLRA